MMGLIGVVYVFLGGGIGSVCRYFVNNLAAKTFGAAHPLGTLGVNLLGALLMGVLMEWIFIKASFSLESKLLLGTGFLGGFTTFSSYILEIVQLYEQGMWIYSFVYAIGSLVVGIGMLLLGMYCAKFLLT